MLHVVTGSPPGSGDDVLRAMFEARKRVFVDLLGWRVPIVDGRYEVDEFDTIDATYIVVTGTAGEHLASARLLPSTRPHILGDLYPSLCDGEVPRGPAIQEITRFCLERRVPAATRRDARDRLVSAIVDVAIDRGITRCTGVAELGWLQQILAFGWRCRPLGLPRMVDGRLLGALAIDIDASTPALLGRAGIYRISAEPETRHAA